MQIQPSTCNGELRTSSSLHLPFPGGQSRRKAALSRVHGARALAFQSGSRPNWKMCSSVSRIAQSRYAPHENDQWKALRRIDSMPNSQSDRESEQERQRELGSEWVSEQVGSRQLPRSQPLPTILAETLDYIPSYRNYEIIRTPMYICGYIIY